MMLVSRDGEDPRLISRKFFQSIPTYVSHRHRQTDRQTDEQTCRGITQLLRKYWLNKRGTEKNWPCLLIIIVFYIIHLYSTRR